MQEVKHVRSSRLFTSAGAIAVASVALTGCSVFGGDDDSGAGGTGESSVQLAEDGSVKNAKATLTRAVEDYDVTVDVLRIKRFDKATRLEFAVTPRSRGASSPLSSSFFGASSSSTTSAVYLLDTKNLRKYPVLTTSDDECVCSSKLQNFPLDRTTVLFADFPLVPEGVSTLSVVVPALGPLPASEVS